jgi:hypothetical protein
MVKNSRKRRRHYQRRIVLFVDFLGFKEHVARTQSEPKHLQRLIGAMDAIGEIGANIADFHRSQKVTQFSDNVVVSYEVNDHSAVFDLLSEIAFTTIDLVERGFLLRGGVTVGEMLHTKKHIVGPAMVEAARLEQKVANSPRILIDPAVLEVAKANGNGEEARYAADYMTEDEDGKYFFDYVSWRSVIAVTGGDNDGYPAYLQKIGEILKVGLGHSDAAVVEKYLWLYGKYAKSLAGFDAMPPNHAYRAENPEVCEDMESLPRFRKLAADAAQRITAEKAKKALAPALRVG